MANEVATQQRAKPEIVKFGEQLEAKAQQLKMALPQHISPEKFQRTIITTAMSDPELLKADRQSLVLACMKAAQDGLLPDKREAAIVVFKENKKQEDGSWSTRLLAQYMATTSEEDTSAIELWDQITQPDSSLVWSRLNTLSVVGKSELLLDIPAEAETDIAAFAPRIGKSTPRQGGFVVIGDGDEDEVEIALVTAVGTPITLDRGVLDTVPRAWPAGTPVWFVHGDMSIDDPTTRSAAETVSYKLRTRTSKGLLDLADAATVSHTLSERPWLPNRPANVIAYGEDFSSISSPVDARARPDPWVTVTWANRNRLLEDSIVLSWTDATVAPETGQTTKIVVLKTDGVTILDTHDALAGTSFDVPDASFAGELAVILRVSSERSDGDGDFESLQSFDHFVQVGSPTFDSTEVTMDSTLYRMDAD